MRDGLALYFRVVTNIHTRTLIANAAARTARRRRVVDPGGCYSNNWQRLGSLLHSVISDL
jgi:hypothetical protein